MAIKNQAITVCYVAWNTSTNSGQTGDAANHTLKLIQDGTEAAPTNSPAEVDSTNCPGTYKLALTAGDMNFNCVGLAGKSSTANVAIIPLTIVTERGILPTATPGNSGGFLTFGTSTAQINPSSGKVPATMGSTDYSGNTVQTGDAYARIGATGSGLSSLAPAATALSTATWTSLRAGNLDNLDVAVSTRSTYAGGAVASVTGNVGGNVVGSVASVTGAVGSVTGNVGGNVVGSVASVTAAVTIDTTTAIPTTGNTANTIADCLNAARAQGFGKWAIVGTTLTLYASDGTTAVRTFTLDSSSAPTSRT